MKFSIAVPIVLTKLAPDADTGTFEGFASTYSRDRDGDSFAPGAWADSIAALNTGKRKVPLLADHNPKKQVGAIDSASETEGGLFVQGRILPGLSDDANRVYALAKAGAMSLSVGFLPSDSQWHPEGGGGKLYRSADLVEVSAVASPSNRESRIVSVRSLHLATASDLEEMFREGALPALPRRLASKFSKLLTRALDGDDDDNDSPELLEIQRGLDALIRTLKDGK
jgi:HK97 family phage prohead protease